MARNVALNVLRGFLANMPVLGQGELYWATDVEELYIGPTPTLIGSALVTVFDCNSSGFPIGDWPGWLTTAIDCNADYLHWAVDCEA